MKPSQKQRKPAQITCELCNRTFPPTRPAQEAAIRRWQQQGCRSIDVPCWRCGRHGELHVRTLVIKALPPMSIRCEHCRRSYDLDELGRALIRDWRRRGLSRGSMTCQKCGENSDFDVRALTILKPEPVFAPLMCPTSGCSHPLVADKRKTWCPECGARWSDRRVLDEAIDRIVKRYRHRKRVYTRTRSGWEPAPFEDQPDDWQDLVSEREVIESPQRPSRSSSSSRSRD